MVRYYFFRLHFLNFYLFFESFEIFYSYLSEMPAIKVTGKKTRYDPLATPETRVNKLYQKHKSDWLPFLCEVIESVCDDNEFVPLADKWNMSLEEFASMLIEKTVANQWLPLDKLIDLGEEIHHIEGGAFIDCLNEAIMAKFTPETLQDAFRAMPCEENRNEYLSTFNQYFGAGEFTL